MAAYPKGGSKITGQRPHVRSGGTVDLDIKIEHLHRAHFRGSPGNRRESRYPNWSRCQIDDLAPSHSLVGAYAVDLDRRDRRWDLKNLAPQSGHGTLNVLLIQAGSTDTCGDFALGIIGDGRNAQPNGGFICLF